MTQTFPLTCLAKDYVGYQNSLSKRGKPPMHIQFSAPFPTYFLFSNLTLYPYLKGPRSTLMV